jgi:hypothetical protein
MARERSKSREENQAVEPRRRNQMSRWEPWASAGPFSMMRRWIEEMDRAFEGNSGTGVIQGRTPILEYKYWGASLNYPASCCRAIV